MFKKPDSGSDYYPSQGFFIIRGSRCSELGFCSLWIEKVIPTKSVIFHFFRSMSSKLNQVQVVAQVSRSLTFCPIVNCRKVFFSNVATELFKNNRTFPHIGRVHPSSDRHLFCKNTMHHNISLSRFASPHQLCFDMSGVLLFVMELYLLRWPRCPVQCSKTRPSLSSLASQARACMYICIEVALRGIAHGIERSNLAKERDPSKVGPMSQPPRIPSVPRHARWLILMHVCANFTLGS